MKIKKLNNIFKEKNKNILVLISLVLLIISIFFFEKYIIAFFLSCFIILISIKIKNIIYIFTLSRRISLEEIENIEKEIDNSLLEFRNNFIITNSYIIRYGLIDSIILHKDIIMIYIDKTINIKSFDTHLVIITKANKKYKYLLEHASFLYKDDYFDILTIIKQRNWNILVGYNKVNVNMIKEKYGFKVFK